MLSRPWFRESLSIAAVCIGLGLTVPSWCALVIKYWAQIAVPWAIGSLNIYLGSPGVWNFGLLTWTCFQFLAYMMTGAFLILVPGLVGIYAIRFLNTLFEWLSESRLPILKQ